MSDKQKSSSNIDNVVINKAIEFIYTNLNDDIDVEDVARYCGYSKFHLTRMFKEATGEGIYEFIKRTKLERSAWRLKVERGCSVTEIGEDMGYSSSNFATAFKKQLDISPAKYRKESEIIVQESSFAHGMSLDDMEEATLNITVEHLPEYFFVYERKKGNYHNLKDEWCEFIDRYREYSTDESLFLECTIDDPSITDADECMYQLCMTIPENDSRITANPNIFTSKFEAGKYAVYHFKGYPQFLFMIYQGIFCRWLSKTGNKLDDRPIYDIYRKIEPDGYLEIDICFPLK